MFDISLNDFARVILVPLAIVFLNFIAELIIAMSTGIAKENRSIKVVYLHQDNKRIELITDPTSLLEFKQKYNAIKILSVERLPSLKWYEYPSIPFNLIFTSLAATGATFFSPRSQEIVGIYGWVFLANIFGLIIVTFLTSLTKHIENENYLILIPLLALGISFFAASFSFYMLWEALI